MMTPCFATLLSVAALAFSPIVGTAFLDQMSNRPLPQRRQTPFAVKATSSYQETIQSDQYKAATLLLGILLERRSQDLENTFDALLSRLTPSYKEMRYKQEIRIESLVKELIECKENIYDPTQSLLGSLFCTLYWLTPGVPDPVDPLWERVSLKKENIKGQQYFLSRDFDEQVINYSEIWGPNVHLTAKGTFSPIPKQEESRGLFGVFAKKKIGERYRQCPDVFQVNATGVTLNAMGFSLQLPISGSSLLVVGYADPRIRIFISPVESSSIVGNWEEAGLVVVQVRSDLVVGDVDPIDLR